MEINCPKCNKPLPLLDEKSVETTVGPEANTIRAEGVNCSDCGWIPFAFEQNDADIDFELGPVKTLIAHFELIKALGKGGFGTVWLAEDVRLGRRVALKIPVTSGQSVSLLLHEAQSAAQLRHPNIVSVYETGQSDSGEAYIASEYIDGLNLRDILTAGRPTHQTVINLLITVADALEHAHEAGIIHRDIKPANIMLDSKGVPYVADFGLAKQVSANQSISSEGQVLGTANYMSPEQATGQAKLTDHRTDIYSVGVMLFQMLTGHLPFRGNTRAVIHQKTSQDAPSPRTLEPSVPKDLETICVKCLERDPEKRFASAKRLKEELQRVKRGEPILSRPIGSIEKVFRWSKRYPLVSGLSVGLLLSLTIGIILTSWLWREAVRNGDLARGAVYRSQMSLAAQHYERGDVHNIRAILDRISADKQMDSLREFSWNYYDRMLDGFPLTVMHGDDVRSVSVAGDGNLLATVGILGDCSLWSGETEKLQGQLQLERGKFTAVDFSPRRLQLVTGDTTGFISIWNPNELTVPLKSVKHGPPVAFVRYSPDGEFLLSAGKKKAVRIWRQEDESLVAEIPTGTDGISAVEFSPDGTQVVIGNSSGLLRIWRIEGREKVLEWVNSSNSRGEGVGALCFSADGTRIAVAGHNGNYRIYSADGELLTEQNTFQGKLGSAIFLKGDRHLACTGTVNTLQVFDTESGKRIASYPTHRLGAGVASQSQNKRFLAIGSGDGTAKVLRGDRLKLPQILWHESPVRNLCFSEDNTTIFSLAESGEIKQHSIQTGNSSVVVGPSKEKCRMFAYSPERKTLIRGVPQPEIELVQFNSQAASDTKPKISSAMIPQRALAGFHLFPASGQLIAISRSGTVLKYSLDDPTKLIDELTLESSEPETGEVSAFAGSIDEQELAVGFDDGTIYVLGINSLEVRRQFAASAPPSAIDFCARTLVVGLSLGKLELFDLANEQTSSPRELEGHGARITAIKSFPDGKSFVTASRDFLLKIWDLESGDPMTTLHGHQKQIFSIAISSDEKTIASGGLEGDIHVWRSRRD